MPVVDTLTPALIFGYHTGGRHHDRSLRDGRRVPGRRQDDHAGAARADVRSPRDSASASSPTTRPTTSSIPTRFAGPGARRRGSARRVLLLPVRRPRVARRLAAGLREAGRDPRGAGRELHRSRRDRDSAAEGPLRRALRGRAVRGAVQAESRNSHPEEPGRGRVQPEGRVHLQEATRRGGRHPHQPDRRDRAGQNWRN